MSALGNGKKGTSPVVDRKHTGVSALRPSRPQRRGRDGTSREVHGPLFLRSRTFLDGQILIRAQIFLRGRAFLHGRPFLRGRLFLVGLSAVVVGPAVVLAGSAVPAGAANLGSASACTGTIGGLLVSSGSSQTAKAGTGFTSPVAAEVVDTGGCPLGSVDVEFVAPATGAAATFPGSATTATVASGTDGVSAAPTLTANDVSGSYTVLASIPGTGFQVSFELTNTTSGVATSVGVSSGNNQSAKVSEQFPLPLAVNVLDSYGAPVGDADITFTIVPTNGAGASFVGGATVAAAETTGIGTATSPLLVAGSTAGSFTVEVSVSGVSKLAVFTLTDLASAPYAISPGAGTSQEAQLGTDFAVPLAVTVTDASSNPVVGARVTFSGPSSGASGVFAGHGASVVVNTNSKGVALAPSFSANAVTGGYIVTARVAGLPNAATFAMVNTARTGASAPGMAGSYWLATTDGQVVASGKATRYGALTGRALSGHVVDMAATPNGRGYWLVTSGGAVHAFGDAGNYGSVPKSQPHAAIVGMAATPDGHGYWLAASNGAVYAFGDGHYYGSASTNRFGGQIVGISPAPSGKGYWLAAKDGGVLAFGQATFYGSAGGVRLTAPIVGIAPAPSGEGYWLVAEDGGVFAFGRATFYGAAKGISANPVVGLVPVPDGDGYWVLSSNGTVAGFGNASSQGSPLAKGTVVAGATFS